MTRRPVWILCALALALWVPGSASAAPPPNPLAGPYLFVGGGLGGQFGLDVDNGLAATFRWGPSLELGGDLGPFNAAVGADLRVPVLTFVARPLDLDVTAALGLITPTPLVRFYVRLRGGLGWRWTAGAKGVMSVLIAPDMGLRFRLPATKAAFQIGIAAGPRVVPSAIPSSTVDVELRLGLKFP